MNRTPPPPPTQGKRSGPPPPPPKIARKAPPKIQITNQQPQQTSFPQGQLSEPVQTQIKQQQIKETIQITNPDFGITNQDNTKTSPNLSRIQQQNKQPVQDQQQPLPELIDEPIDNGNSNTMNTFDGEFTSEISNNQVENVQLPVRIAPPAPPKKIPNPGQGRPMVPGRKPLNMPKPPPPIIRPNIVADPEPQVNNQSDITPVEEEKIQTNNNDQGKKFEENKLVQEKIASPVQEQMNTSENILETPVKKQQPLQKQHVQVKKPNRPVPPPGLTPKVATRVPPKAKIPVIKQKVQQEAPQQNPVSEKPIEKQPEPAITAPPPPQTRQKPKPQPLSTIQKITENDQTFVPQSAKIKPPVSQISSQQSKHNLTPKYTNLKNKLKDFSIRKEKMLESSQSDSQMHSQTYSEIYQNRNKTVNTHNNTQSVYIKASGPVKKEQRVEEANVGQGRNNFGVEVNSFGDDEQGRFQIGEEKNVGIGKNNGDLNQLQRNASQQIFPQHQKQTEQVQDKISKIKSSIPQSMNNNSDKWTSHDNKQIQEELSVENKKDDNVGKQITKNEKDTAEIEDIMRSQNNGKQKDMSYSAKEPIKQVEQEHKQPNNQIVAQQSESVPAPKPVPPKRLGPKAPATAPKQKHPNLKPPAPSSQIHHQHPTPSPSTLLTSTIKTQTASYKKQSQIAQIQQMLQQFNSKKQNYLQNAQELSEICSTNREEEFRQVAVIKELLLRLEEQNVKLKTVLLNY